MKRARTLYGGVILSGLILAACQQSATPQAAPESAEPQAAALPSAATAFQVDPYWPKELPEDWLLGNVVGTAIDSHDNVWITHRPNSHPAAATTPPVIALDPEGNVIRSWGGSGPGYEWGTQVHGLHVDYQDNVWVGFGGGLPYDENERHTTDNALVLKFTPEGEFLLQIGKFGEGTHGSNNAMYLGNPTDVAVDPQTDEAYIADGYLNRRIIVFDANTGAYKRHWGAYGKTPDDTPQPRRDPNGPPPQHFDTPHCVNFSADELVYVCDRGNRRIQVFRTDGTFVKEALIPAGDMALSPDPEQRLLFVQGGGGGIQTVLRESFEVLATFGRRGRMAGQFMAPHSVAVDSKGNLYVSETLEGSRIQKFVPKGMTSGE